ncbi:hypothetical protein L3I77_004346 [Vibrio vulnificus]|nr:hypothetical protein [Vibrio vulnificus]EIU7554390.1 hypothetical protein [Vibrio vulnificus]
MRSLKENILSVLFLCALIVAIILTLYFVPSITNNWFSENAPAWIQAIGSIAAIFAAALISSNQYRNERRLESERVATSEINKLMVVKALMVRSHQLSKDITTAFSTKEDDDFSQVTPALMIDTHSVLMDLPTFEIPNGLLALDVLTVGRGLSVLAENWEDFCASVAKNNSIEVREAEPLLELAGEIESITGDAIKICNTEIAQRELIAGTKLGWRKQANKAFKSDS